MVRFIVKLHLISLAFTESASVAHASKDTKKRRERARRAAGFDIGITERNLRKHESRDMGEPCKTWDSSPCASSREYCSLEAGKCMVEIDGACQSMPESCTFEHDPVCGCDMESTFGNACMAAGQGANVWHRGSCEKGNECSRMNPCKNTDLYFCRMEVGVCGKPYGEQRGTCDHYDEFGACIGSWEPVCGCDGKIYGNECQANFNAGVSVAYRMDDSDDDVLPGDHCEIREWTSSDERKEERKEEQKEEEASSSSSSSSGPTSKSGKKKKHPPADDMATTEYF